MKRQTISQALNCLEERHISETEEYALKFVHGTSERNIPMERYTYRRTARRFVTILVAACLLLSLGLVAYAVNLFGIRALLIDSEDYAPAASENGGYLSITQPQEVPEEMSAEIKTKIENSTKAWAEWDSWRKENALRQPDVFIAPEGCDIADYIENADGTYTVIFYDAVLTHNNLGEVINVEHVEMERRIATAEEYEQDMAFAETVAKGFSGYDFKYHVESQEMANKLEKIAAKYGLNVRHTATQLFQNFGGQTEFLSREELTDKINQVCARNGELFRTVPTGYDKFYYFDEGTFAISFYTTDDFSNSGTRCYLYNSPYGTLSSGFEIIAEVEDISTMSTYVHTTPDGAELTVCHNAADMFAYIYLENSFVTMTFHQPKGLSPEEINAIVDMVDFSAIL